jgi:hypothetical protein
MKEKRGLQVLRAIPVPLALRTVWLRNARSLCIWGKVAVLKRNFSFLQKTCPVLPVNFALNIGGPFGGPWILTCVIKGP